MRSCQAPPFGKSGWWLNPPCYDSLWLQRHSLHIICLQRQQLFLELQNFIGSFMRLIFITQFKIEFLRPFTDRRKVLGKMPDSPKWKQSLHLSCAISLEKYSRWSWFWYTCVKWWYLQGFFLIFDIFIFQGVRVVIGQKIAQDDQKVPPVIERHISGTIYHMILINGTHVWKDNMSRVFLYFSKF